MPSPPLRLPHQNGILPPSSASLSSAQTNFLNALLSRHSITATNGHRQQSAEQHDENYVWSQNAQQGNDNNSALFARTVDSLQHFLSPNVVLLPVAFHSLSDEQHIQLLGMPQTVIPIAVHPQMQRKFPVRPLLIESAMAAQQTMALTPKIGVATTDQQTTTMFHLPLAFRQSLTRQTQQMFGAGERSSGSSNTSFVAAKSNLAEMEGGTGEPLDLSMTVKSANGTQRRRRTTAGQSGNEEKCEKRSKLEENACSSPSAVATSTSPKQLNGQKTESPPRKKYPCDLCGDVSFLALETLMGHKTYYCRNRLRPEAEATTVSSCPIPTLAETQQLGGHEQQRQLHDISLPFVCADCGYRAFTVRGLRSHERLSHSAKVEKTENATSEEGNAGEEDAETKNEVTEKIKREKC